VQIHYLEEYKRRFHDRKAWPFFVESGAADSNVSYAHFIHPDDTILHQAAQAGASMIWNPLSNGRLASGLADIPKYISSGLGVGMGVDGAASADIADPFENMRMGMYALRMQHKNPDVMLPIEILRLHTLKTAQVLNVDQQVGSLEVGKKADLLIINPNKPSTGAVFDPAATLVFACNAYNIESVIVAGEELVKNGDLIKHDTAKINTELRERIKRIQTSAAQAKH
jgi:5-methylthioadenosine/S-adenosylhomocysteine deaminase